LGGLRAPLPKFIYIYPAGLLGCIVIGTINRIGSLFYYGGLGTLDASMAQLSTACICPWPCCCRGWAARSPTGVLVRVTLALVALALLAGFGAKRAGLGPGVNDAGQRADVRRDGDSQQYILYEIAPTVPVRPHHDGRGRRHVLGGCGMRPSLDILRRRWPILLLDRTACRVWRCSSV
jgi:hypothetical protein